MTATEGRIKPQSISDDVRAIEEALAAGPTPGEWAATGSDVTRGRRRICAHVCAGDALGIGEAAAREKTNAAYIAAAHPARLRRVLDTMQALSGALTTLLPMVEEWHEEFPRDVGNAEAPAIEAARAALALYEGKQ